MVSHFIVFFGPDGSGKSTHVNLLLARFLSNGIKTRKVWIRSPHTMAYVLSRFMLNVGFYRVALNPFGKETRFPLINQSRMLQSFWVSIELASVIPLILLKVYLPMLLGYSIIAERYVVDTAVNVAYYIGDMNFLNSRIVKILFYFTPKNARFVHLDSDYSTLTRRRKSRVEPASFIDFQRRAYELVGNSLEATPIDTSKGDVEETSTKIWHLLGMDFSKTGADLWGAHRRRLVGRSKQ